MLRCTAVSVGPLEVNCWLIVDEASGQLAVVDPGDDADRIVAAIRETGATPTEIWLTHAHFDHVGGLEELLRSYDIPVRMHPAELPVYASAAMYASAFGLRIEQPVAATVPLAEGDTLTLGGLSFDVMHAPGHSPGHVVIHGHGIAIVGDCLFAGSVGRTDLPLASPSALAASLQRIAALPIETQVLPGHGNPTTVGTERRTNPFLNGEARVLAS